MMKENVIKESNVMKENVIKESNVMKENVIKESNVMKENVIKESNVMKGRSHVKKKNGTEKKTCKLYHTVLYKQSWSCITTTSRLSVTETT